MLWAKVRSLSLKRVAQTKLCSSYHAEENSTFEFQEYLDTYLQKRGAVLELPNSRPERVKDNLEAAEKLLFSHNPIKVLWRGHTRDCFQVILSNGSLVTYSFGENGDISKVEIDSSLHFVVSHSIVSVTWGVHYVIVALENKLLMVLQPKKGDSTSSKISDFMVTQNTDVQESITGIVLEEDSKLVLVNTGKFIYVFSLVQEKQGMVLVLTTKYDARHRSNRIKYVRFSHLHKKALYCLEERPHEYVDFRLLTLASAKLNITNSFRFSIADRGDIRVKCADISPDEARCIVGFSDGSVAVYDILTGVENVVGPFSNSSVCCVQWHKANSVLCVCYEEGEILLFDHALQPIKFLLPHNLSLSSSIPPFLHLNISALLGHKCRIHHMSWGGNGTAGILGPALSRAPKHDSTHDTIAIVIDRGPVIVVRLELGAHSHGKLSNGVVINNRLSSGQCKEAIEILASLSNTREFHVCFVNIVNYLFDVGDKKDMNEYLKLVFEKCWALLLSSPGPHLEHATNMYIRYFYKLLGGLKLEEAYCAAVNIDMPDLFMELLMYCKNEPVILAASVDHLKTRFDIDVPEHNKKEAKLERALKTMMLDERDDVLVEGMPRSSCPNRLPSKRGEMTASKKKSLARPG